MEFNIIKKRISFKEKELISGIIADNYFVEDSSGTVIDFSEIKKERALVYFLLSKYSDLDMTQYDESEEDEFLEKIIESDNYEKFLTALPYDEVLLLHKAIDAKIEFKKRQLDQENNIAVVIKTFLDSLISKIPDKAEMAGILENFKDFDMNKFGELKDVVKLLGGNQ